jgi:hypothetical protein
MGLLLSSVFLWQDSGAQIHNYSTTEPLQMVNAGQVRRADKYRLRLDNSVSPTVGSTATSLIFTLNSAVDVNGNIIPPTSYSSLINKEYLLYSRQYNTPGNSIVYKARIIATAGTTIDLEFPTALTFSNWAATYSSYFTSNDWYLSSMLEGSQIDLNQGGIITCHPFEQGIGGGVLGVLTPILNMNGGVIFGDASGDVAPTASANGGAGGIASTSYDPFDMGGNSSNNSRMCTVPANSGCLGTPGTNGNSMISGIPGSSAVVSPIIPQFAYPISNSLSSSNAAVARMGRAAYSTIYGGDGGGAGGHGGTGGIACNTSVPGSTGFPASNGFLGDDAFEVASGGAVVIVKAEQIYFATSITSIPALSAPNRRKLITANGENGIQGADGGNGSSGGVGGYGSAGTCNGGSLELSGGVGGYGQLGVGGTGAQGGKPGEKGTVWVMSSNAPLITMTSTVYWDPYLVSVNGGLGGKGGNGGYTYNPLPIDPLEVPLPCGTIDKCPPSQGPQTNYTCDCEKIMCLISDAQSASLTGTGVDILSSTLKVSYDPTLSVALSEPDASNGNTIYFCPMSNISICTRIFENFAGVSLPDSRMDVDLSKTTLKSGNCLTDGTYWRRAYPSNLFDYNKSSMYIECLTEIGLPKCYLHKCSPEAYNIPGLDLYVKTGADGNNYPYPQEVTDVLVNNQNGPNFFNFGATPGPRESDQLNVVTQNLVANIYPNPASSILNIELQSKESINGQITDLLGKVYLNFKFDAEKFSIDLSKFSKGAYVIKLNTSKGFNSQIFVKE